MSNFVEDNPITPEVLAGNTPDAAPETPPAAGAETPAPDTGTPAAPEAPASEASEAPAPVDWNERVTGWGGEQAIEDALAIADALRDEEGVRALVEEGLKHLGLDPTKVFTPAEPTEEDDPDRLLTAREVEERLAAERQARANEVLQDRIRVASVAVDNTRTALGIESEEEWDLVRTFAQRHTTPDELDPDRLAEAVKAGYADMQRAVEAQAKRYTEQRAAANDSVPEPIVGGGVSSGDGDAPAPKNMDEARVAARRMLKERGDFV